MSARPKEQTRREMVDAVPLYYHDNYIARNILEREADGIAAANAAIYDVLAQFYVDTATWGLADWERVLGLRSTPSMSDEDRRANIKAKLRGIGTVTVELIKNVAESYIGGDVDVAEDFAGYTVTITFIGERGIPERLDDVKAALRAIIPAHLAISYKFTYITWAELDALGWTWADVDAANYTWAEFERIGTGV